MNLQRPLLSTQKRTERSRRSVVFALLCALLFHSIPGAWHAAAMAMPSDVAAIAGLKINCAHGGFELSVDRDAIDGSLAQQCPSCVAQQSLDSALPTLNWEISLGAWYAEQPDEQFAQQISRIALRPRNRAPPKFL